VRSLFPLCLLAVRHSALGVVFSQSLQTKVDVVPRIGLCHLHLMARRIWQYFGAHEQNARSVVVPDEMAVFRCIEKKQDVHIGFILLRIWLMMGRTQYKTFRFQERVEISRPSDRPHC
jgi:hypothetical protein